MRTRELPEPFPRSAAQPPEPAPRDLGSLLEDCARLVWVQVAELLREVRAGQATVEELFARLFASMVPQGLRVGPCHVFNRDGIVGPPCKLAIYHGGAWAGLPTREGTLLVPARSVFALVHVEHAITPQSLRAAMGFFGELTELWAGISEPPLTLFLGLEGTSAFHLRDHLPEGKLCPVDVLGVLDRWLIVFQDSRDESGPLVGAGKERYPRIDYLGRYTPLVLHLLLHQHLLPDYRGAEHDAMRRELARMVASLLPMYDRAYCSANVQRLKALTEERRRRHPTEEHVMFCSDFLSYLDLLDPSIRIDPRA